MVGDVLAARETEEGTTEGRTDGDVRDIKDDGPFADGDDDASNEYDANEDAFAGYDE